MHECFELYVVARKDAACLALRLSQFSVARRDRLDFECHALNIGEHLEYVGRVVYRRRKDIESRTHENAVRVADGVSETRPYDRHVELTLGHAHHVSHGREHGTIRLEQTHKRVRIRQHVTDRARCFAAHKRRHQNAQHVGVLSRMDAPH